jgi:hypothetical protein
VCARPPTAPEYQYFASPLSKSAAVSACTTLGKSLVTISSNEQNLLVGSLLPQSEDSSAWIANIVGDGGFAEPFLPDRGGSNANGLCVRLFSHVWSTHHDAWDDQPCTDALPYVCVTPPTAPSTLGGGTFGDPHFKTWNGKQFDFHGVCDLVLVSNPEFGNGIGLDVHIRTRKTRQWSYVDSAAARIGDDILEVRGGKNNTFWINGVQGNINTDEMVVANYDIKYQNISEKSKKFVVDLGDGEGIIFKTWNSFVSVQIENPKHENFVGSVGLMGSFPKGLKIDRTNSIVEDFNVFGKEWQVLSTEQKLFHNIEDPQHPQKCEIPSSVEMRRRLAASLVTFDEAEKACVGADSDNKELCIFDIMATNDLSSAGVY